jgi:hypothetical protein
MPEQNPKKKQPGPLESTLPMAEDNLERGLRVLARAIAFDLMLRHKPSRESDHANAESSIPRAGGGDDEGMPKS